MRRLVLIATSVLAMTAPLPEARAGDGGKGGPSPPQSNAFGKSLDEWMLLYFTWYFGGDQADHVGRVRFLPLPQGEPVALPGPAGPITIFVGSLDLTLEPGTPLVVPVLDLNGEYYEEPDVPPDDPADLDPAILTGADVLVKLDGKALIDSTTDDLASFFFGPSYFAQRLPYDAPQDRPIYDDQGNLVRTIHAVGAIWVEGIGFVLPPLSVGEHTLTIDAVYNGFAVGFSNTWHITVKP